jgi:transcriptional regulator with XRE-family HTH domain
VKIKKRKLKEPQRGQYILLFKKYRNFRHMTQEELSFRIGLTPSYLSFFEQDNITRTRSPKLNLIRDIAYALKVCPNSIVIFPCNQCELRDNCRKRKDVKNDNKNFFEDNLEYYI